MTFKVRIIDLRKAMPGNAKPDCERDPFSWHSQGNLNIHFLTKVNFINAALSNTYNAIKKGSKMVEANCSKSIC